PRQHPFDAKRAGSAYRAILICSSLWFVVPFFRLVAHRGGSLLLFWRSYGLRLSKSIRGYLSSWSRSRAGPRSMRPPRLATLGQWRASVHVLLGGAAPREHAPAPECAWKLH